MKCTLSLAGHDMNVRMITALMELSHCELDGQALRQEITEKRNQDKLRCYPLLPMTPGDTEEALRRYEFIQKFLKESKQFGSQRRESEKKACNSAMENLAITTGVLDVDRLTWQMEGAKLQSILPLTAPQVIEGVTVCLAFAENGDAAVHLEKDGKTIKTPPKTLSKHPAFLELKETAKSLKEQKRRARNTLERAMTSASAFEPEELLGLLQNPVLSPMVRTLVWVSGERFGLPVAADGHLALSQVDGVSWTGSHARIHGKLANYSVHLGSGVVHAEGIGMLAILPVHSQARGRVFLPFADDDPKTAEILSKIILLAEDHKLKDPSILQQLH